MMTLLINVSSVYKIVIRKNSDPVRVNLTAAMNALSWFCLLVFCHSLSGPWQSLAECPQNNKTNLKFLFMGSSGAAFNSLGSVVGSIIALERINANNSILKDYTLSYSAIEDTKV